MNEDEGGIIQLYYWVILVLVARNMGCGSYRIYIYNGRLDTVLDGRHRRRSLLYRYRYYWYYSRVLVVVVRCSIQTTKRHTRDVLGCFF